MHSKSLKQCHKNFENPLTNKKLKPKNDLDPTIVCTREVIQKSLNQNSSRLRDFVQEFGPQLSIFYCLVLARKRMIRSHFVEGVSGQSFMENGKGWCKENNGYPVLS